MEINHSTPSFHLQPFSIQAKDASKNLVVTSVTDVSSETSSSKSSSTENIVIQDVEKGVKPQAANDRTSSEPRSESSIRGRMIGGYDFLRLVVFTAYRQLFTIICIANIIAIVVVAVRNARSKTPPLADMANAAAANLTCAILVRQDYMKNILYHVCWSVPHSAPLWLRKKLAKVYENGGVHSGGAVCSVAWFVVFAAFLTKGFVQGTFDDIAVLTLVWTLLSIFLTITIGAIPQIRRKYHDLFENTHRLGGWSGIILFWPTLVLFARSSVRDSPNEIRSLGIALVKLPSFWLLIILSAHTIYPWLLLRKVEVVKTEHLSDHAVRLYFSPKEKIPAEHGVSISDAPLREWHAFAAIHDVDGSEGGATSCIISKAGDWTAKTIESPGKYYYMRGVHATGVLAMAKLFRRVVLVTTGSGVGPCMAVFGQLPNTKLHIIWSTPSPTAIFGEKICQTVLRTDPNAVIWDTRKEGQRRPDLIQMAYDAYHEMDAEAVFFISNRKLTKMFVEGLGRRGVPAFAPVFDS